MDQPLNARLNYVTADGKLDRAAIALAAQRKARIISNPNRYSASVYAREFADFTAADWRHIAESDVMAEARGELALYEARKNARKAGLQTVSDGVPETPIATLFAAE